MDKFYLKEVLTNAVIDAGIEILTSLKGESDNAKKGYDKKPKPKSKRSTRPSPKPKRKKR